MPAKSGIDEGNELGLKKLKTEKKLTAIFSKSLPAMAMLSALFFLQSCVQSPSNGRKSLLSSSNSTAGSKTEAKLPEFKEGNNFIQNGGVVYTTSVNFDLSFSDTLQLRGKDVDSYIRTTGTQTISCLTGRFTASTVNQVNILAVMPHSVYNFTTQTLEYYYSIAPADETTNKNFCQKTGLINKLALYSSLTPVYKIGALCPSGTCVSSTYISQPLELYTQSGYPLTQIQTRQLTYAITNHPNITTPIGQSCVTNSECIAQGYNCCSLGQCVKDLALKPNVDQNSTDYVQALQDILNNPSHIYLYPQYYFICSTPTTSPSAPTSPSNPVNEAGIRLKNLQDLYNCTTKVEGELGICTKTISGALVGVEYSAGRDDRNFSSTYTNQSSSSYTPTQKEDLISIQEISFGEVTLFNYDQIANEATVRPDPYTVSNYLTINGHHNDDNSTGATIKVTAPPPGAVSSDLVIKYKTDASCSQINTSLAKCEKFYIQGQQKSGDTVSLNRRGRVTDHFPASNIFKLPYYANTNKTVTVEVDGILMRKDLDWELNSINPASINFFPTSSGLKVFDTQKVKISFFVDLSVYHVMDSKLESLQKIKDTCHCADLNCGLRPVKNTSGTITDYACVYPDPNPVVPPVSQQIYLSSKTVPVRYFDSTGVSKASVNGDTLAQEGKAFSYRKDNLLNPVNMPDILNPVAGEDTYVGFNEIYGSLSYSNNSAKPAKEVSVTNGKTYDLYVDKGSYSNCVQCGNDYYSQLNKLFPLTQFGGGVVPLQSRTARNQSNGVRADDMSFGRACLVPATMLPWSHSISSDPQEQRLNRMRAQHFLYANGYQRDWFGFDYGAVIGSFDGVKWFAIGTNRRIKADSNKLFLAVNGAFGDLALESTFSVTINDGSLNPIGSNMITSDLESDGAQCQKFHQCSSDNDCATTLGWDYACTSVNDTTTSWPRFDSNAKEIPDSQREDNRLASILGVSSGKRCVYRGRGSACTQDYRASILDVRKDFLFNQSQEQTQHSCSSNNYCQSITTNNVLSSKFNNRIVRYGKVRIDENSDNFGLGAKVPGRPMEFNAIEQMRSETVRNFNRNKIAGICIPGRSPEVANFISQNSTAPSDEYLGDRVLGIGMTYNKGTPKDDNYLISCAVMDDTNNYYYSKNPMPDATTLEKIRENAATQSISTNALYKIMTILDDKGIKLNIFTNNSTELKSLTFTENRCMRAPGASCFSDLDCAPSKVIADKAKMLSASDTSIIGDSTASPAKAVVLNKYELKFWQEELVCSQATAKSNPAYSAFNNRCCREVGKTISIGHKDLETPIENSKIPGVDIDMSDENRYSRVATVYKNQETDATNYPALETAAKDQCSGTCANIADLTNQFKTFTAFAERTSCSGDWIRNFSNGDHIWNKDRFQVIKSKMFQCMNWLPGKNGNNNLSYSCEGLEEGDPNCKLTQTSPSSTKAKGIMNFLAKLELTGIPQIAIETEDHYNTTTEGDLSCRSYPGSPNTCYPLHPMAVDDPSDPCSASATADKYAPPKLIFATAAAAPEAKEYTDGTKRFYSAADETNFQLNKKIFKADEVASCLPAGTTMAVGADPSLCCTGFINGKTNKCQLQDYVDVSIYTNRLVSSEAKKLNANLFDSSGYIKDPSYVAQLACEKSMCASGTLALGVLISNLKNPGQEKLNETNFRFLEDNIKADDGNGGLLTLYNNGLKLNTHAYCFPKDSGSSSSGSLTIISCGN